jgi:catechol 2,3-dioxygenase-like lactoylglutathione lyase family enzyme
MQLGAFSVSLAVKDLSVSRAFYEKLGFRATHDSSEHGYLILKNGEVLIGLFQGMFEGNILTFNPGWDQSAQEVNPFTDVRELQARLQADGIELIETADPETSGPAHITLVDPDGNAILIDQHR